jgi:hypothetical protein
MDLERVERELKKRWEYPYRWGRKQSDIWDRRTNFIYTTYGFASLRRKTEGFDEELKNYAFNRWYNFWSARAVEYIFASHPRVKPHKNRYDKLIDFHIDHIPFDHKTSVFPRGFGVPFSSAKKNKRDLIAWLYSNQSQEGRKHLKNRLFIVLHNGVDGEHWKMKAEIALLKSCIESYLSRFEKEKLIICDFGEGRVFSDIIWAEK